MTVLPLIEKLLDDQEQRHSWLFEAGEKIRRWKLEERFRAKCRLNPQTGCLEWVGCTDDDGYGRFSINGRPRGAHRVAIELAGVVIPDGEVVDHTCRNRKCVNPDHLRVVDRRTNVFENSEAPAKLNASKAHCLRGHPFSGANLHVRKNGKRECLACCAMRERARYSTKGFNRLSEGEEA